MAAKILTRNYNPELVTDVKNIGLATGDVLNMYDYFQEVVDVEAEDLDVRYAPVIDKNAYEIEGIDPNKSLLHYHDRTVAQVNIAAATIGLVGSIDYFDSMNHTVAKDIWDRRGFRSSTKYTHPDGKEGPQVFFDRHGKPKMEIIRMNIDGKLYNTMFKLLDYKGRLWRFNTEGELFTFFMNELAATEPTVFINDRPSLINEVANVQGAKGKWQFLHNAHSKNTAQEGGSKKVYDYLKPLFVEHLQDFDGVIVPTAEQGAEIKKFFDFKNVVVQWDSFAEQKTMLETAQRDRNKLIFVGRVSAEKQPEQAIQVLAKAKKKLPDLHLEFYGYAPDADLNTRLADLAKKLKVTDAVTYNDYQSNEQLAKKMQDAAGILSVSVTEGFGANVLQAMSFGVPVFGYRVKYGFKELVDEGQNGELALLNASQPLANQLVEDLSNEDQWRSLCQKAYEKAQLFDSDHAWQQWQVGQQQIANLFTK